MLCSEQCPCSLLGVMMASQPPVLLELTVPTAGVGYVLPDSCDPPSGALIIILRGGMDYKRAISVLPFGGLSLCTA